MAMNKKTEREIRRDRLRFTKNKLSSNMILLAIAANALYFVSIYGSDVGNYYYKIFIGGSIIYNLVFMLAAFLSSEGVKNYKLSYACLSVLLGVLQVARIFGIPIRALRAKNPVAGAKCATVMSGGQFRYVTICLCVSAALLAFAGIMGVIRSSELKKHIAKLENNEREGTGDE